MPVKPSSKSKNLAATRIKKLRARVRELEETFSAIQSGLVDAVVVNTPKGENVFTLHGAEHPYRVLVENMNEGAATLDPDGTVLEEEFVQKYHENCGSGPSIHFSFFGGGFSKCSAVIDRRSHGDSA